MTGRGRERESKDGEREGQRGARDGPPSPETPTEPSPLTAFIYFKCLDNFTFLTLSTLKPLTFYLFCSWFFVCSCFLQFIVFFYPPFQSILDPFIPLPYHDGEIYNSSVYWHSPLPGWFYDHSSNQYLSAMLLSPLSPGASTLSLLTHVLLIWPPLNSPDVAFLRCGPGGDVHAPL